MYKRQLLGRHMYQVLLCQQGRLSVQHVAEALMQTG